MTNFSQLIDTVTKAVKDGLICCEMDKDRIVYSPFDDSERYVVYPHTASKMHFERIQSYYKVGMQ